MQRLHGKYISIALSLILIGLGSAPSLGEAGCMQGGGGGTGGGHQHNAGGTSSQGGGGHQHGSGGMNQSGGQGHQHNSGEGHEHGGYEQPPLTSEEDRHQQHGEPAEGPTSPEKETFRQTQMWTCPMHPQVQRPEPGNCPICGMRLVPLSEKTGRPSGDGEIL